MTTCGCTPVRFFCTCENGFYFEVPDTDVDEDTFSISSQCSEHLTLSNDNKFLVLNAEKKYQIQPQTEQQQCQPEYKFNLQIYKDSCLNKRPGRAVMLYANKDGKKMVACCRENREIYPEEMVLPKKIENPADKALFYMRDVPGKTNKFMFESSLHQTQFLAFENCGNVVKLVLHEVPSDEVDEGTEVHVIKCH